MRNKITYYSLILASALLLSACTPKNKAPVVVPTPTPKLIEIPVSERPIINLTPREDGHMLFLKISEIPKSVASIEYELIYSAKDESVEIEKGLGDTIKDVSGSIERKLLLGTESCTNGCKYKYDEGVGGGTISLKFFNSNGQMSTYESSFNLKSTAQLKKDQVFKLTTDSFEVPLPAKLTGSNYFTLIKQFRGGYSVFSSGTSPLAGDYPKP
ncbi:hypothetical protein HYV64_03075 [Candidatus Shapirobacteria bacterium]|nr:hypothetical protein [Candidatus Shapirobacteria bacterium]